MLRLTKYLHDDDSYNTSDTPGTTLFGIHITYNPKAAAPDDYTILNSAGPLLLPTSNERKNAAPERQIHYTTSSGHRPHR